MTEKTYVLYAWQINECEPIYTVQGETLSRKVICKLLDSGGQPIDVTLSTARLYTIKTDNTKAYLTGTKEDAINGIVSFLLDSQVATVSGPQKCYVSVTDDSGATLLFAGMTINVAPANIDGAVESSNEFTALQDALAIVQDIDNRVPKTTRVNSKPLTGDITLDADDVNAVPYTEKGAAGGVMALPSTLPAVGKILKMGTGGVPAEAVDGTDYGVRIKNILGASVTQNNTDYALTEDYTNYKMLLIIGTENIYSNFYASLLLPVGLIGTNSAYITRFWLSATNKLDFWFPNTKTIHASTGFTSPYRITNIYGIK